jgi:putative transposase
MTREEFIDLQLAHQSSGLTLKLYLQQAGISYSTYNYWRKKFCAPDVPVRDIAPIDILRKPSSAPPSFTDSFSSGVSLLFPNGLRAHFGPGSEDVLMVLLDKSLPVHVLP